VGSRKRVWFNSSGKRLELIIRRLYCKAEIKIHHELPDILVPYKRYDAESIEGVVSGETSNEVAVEESTIYCWKSWFSVWIKYALGCLQSISIRYNLPVLELSLLPQSVLQSLGRFVGLASGWLKRVVRPIVNSNLWVTDPFCISVQRHLD
jgi:hypothetical protein